jgi:hypothetical protein
MTPFTDALTELSRNQEPGSTELPDFFAVPELAARRMNPTGRMKQAWREQREKPPGEGNPGDENPGEETGDRFEKIDMALYIAAETAPRHDSEDAFIPYLTAYLEQNWRRQAAERVWSASAITTREEAQLWAKRADRTITRWTEAGY